MLRGLDRPSSNAQIIRHFHCGRGRALLEYRDIYAGGRLIGSASPDVITIVNPATEEVVGAVPSAVGADVDRAVRSARRAFDDGSLGHLRPRRTGPTRSTAWPPPSRRAPRRPPGWSRPRWACRSPPPGSTTPPRPCAILRYYANLARAMDTEETRTAVSFTGRTVVRREPAGVAAVITSWNYPIMLAFSQLAPALAAGCTIVLKPAAATSLSAYILAEAFEAADFPPGVFNLVTGTHQTAGALARHPGVDTVSFSGPTKAGRWIASICGAELKPARLELGGQSAAIILDDADLGQGGRRARPPYLRQLGPDLLRDVPGARPRAALRRPGGRARRAGGQDAGRRPAERGHHHGPARLVAAPRRRGGAGPLRRRRRRARRVRRPAPRVAGPRLLLRADRAHRRDRADGRSPRTRSAARSPP